MTGSAAAASMLAGPELRFSLMDWETSLLERKVGRIDGLDAIRDIAEGTAALAAAEQDALAAGCRLVIARVAAEQFTPIWALEASGFLCVDVGVTFEYDLRKRAAPGWRPRDIALRGAVAADIPALQALVRGRFLTSYYYVTPFLSRADADVLYGEWVANCIRERRADEVLIAEIGDAIVGFITCRRGDQAIGVIDLVSVADGYGSRGIGKTLVDAALDWFRDRALATVHVRTQVTNLPAVNLYVATAARLLKVDTTFMKSITGRRGTR